MVYLLLWHMGLHLSVRRLKRMKHSVLHTTSLILTHPYKSFLSSIHTQSYSRQQLWLVSFQGYLVLSSQRPAPPPDLQPPIISSYVF